MDNNLWTNILAFDFDDPVSEYGFSTRLAGENGWTKEFTRKAIVEYKKFMYLAGTSEQMVSPSGIIDTVWHQHLIFTQSYAALCSIIGKNIQHIPSTHNREDVEKFWQAKERTAALYTAAFGAQPEDIWQYATMYAPLQLPKAAFKIQTVIIIGILVFVVLLLLAYFLLKPLYSHIDNPYFIIGYILLTVFAFMTLEIYNKSCLYNIVKGFNAHTFIHDLRPEELVYLKSQNVADIIHLHTSRLVKEGTITINSNHTIQLNQIFKNPKSAEAFTITSTLKNAGTIAYSILLKLLMQKPVFSQTANAMNTFKKYFIKSKTFGRLFYSNYFVLLFLLLLGLIRFFTGIARDKPVGQLLIILIILAAAAISFLRRLTNLICIRTIPGFYKKAIIPVRANAATTDWQYFMLGTTALSPAMIPVINYTNKSNSPDGGGISGDASSCGSGCGSACSSCGGCGGGD